jgi:SAM-dependent methyltransferase
MTLCDWRNWDVGDVAQRIDQYWRETAFERAHVVALGDLCERYIYSRHFSVLEVGCGTGRIYQQIVPRLLPTPRYFGIDSSLKMLAIARQRCPGAYLHCSDGFALSLPDKVVDYALAFEVAGHLPDVRPLLCELARVSRLGYIATVWPAPEEEGIIDGRECIGGVEFLHRRYPLSWFLGEILASLPAPPFEIHCVRVDSATVAYVVHHSKDTTQRRDRWSEPRGALELLEV